MSRLFDIRGIAGLTEEGVVTYRALYNYLHYVYADAREMGIPLNEITALISRIAIGLESTMVASAHAQYLENSLEKTKAYLPDNMKQTDGYTRDMSKRDDGEGPIGPADVTA